MCVSVLMVVVTCVKKKRCFSSKSLSFWGEEIGKKNKLLKLKIFVLPYTYKVFFIKHVLNERANE